MSEAFDITKFTEIIKKLKELRDQNPNITKEDLARSLGAHFNRTITADAVDAGIEYLQDHNLVEEKIQNELPTPGVEPQNNLPAPGGQPAESKTAESPAGNPPDTNTPPAGNQQPDNHPADNPPPDTTHPAASSPSKDDLMGLEIPADMKPIPIAAIDAFIRRGYLTRNALEALTKHNFKGKAYRKEIEQRLALFEARSPPFNDIPLGVVPVSGGVVPAGIPQTSGGVHPAQSPQIPTIPGSAPDASGIMR